jgi:hypothetical protein
MPTIGRNDPCHCGSTKKYKKCCEAKDQSKQHKELEKKWKEAEKALPKEAEEGKPTETQVPAPGRRAGFAGHGSQKHQPFVGPKMTMPRKSGGG